MTENRAMGCPPSCPVHQDPLANHVHKPYTMNLPRNPTGLSEVEKAVKELVTAPVFRKMQRVYGSWAKLADQLDAKRMAYEVDSYALAHLIRTLDALGALD